MTKKLLPLAGSLINRTNAPFSSSYNKDQYFENCFIEINPDRITSENHVFCVKRSGGSTTSSLTGVSRGSRGSCAVTGISVPKVYFSFVTATGCMVWNNSGTKIGGDIANTLDCASLSETRISGTSNVVGVFTDLSTGALEGWYYPDGGAWTQISDGDFPSFCGEPAHLGGYTFWMTPDGTIVNSDLNSISAYSPASVIPCNAFPDGGVTLNLYKNMIFALGTGGAEFYKNTATIGIGSPLQRIDGAEISIGADQTNPSILRQSIQVGDTVYWIGHIKASGAKGIYRLNGMAPEKVSNSAIDKLIHEGSITNFIGTFEDAGMTHIMCGAENLVFCYTVDTGEWWRFASVNAGAGPFMVPSSACGYNGASYFVGQSGSTTVDKIYGLGGTTFTDNSLAYTTTIRLQRNDFGTVRRKFYNCAWLIGDRQASGTATLKYSDDDGVTFVTAGTFDMTDLGIPIMTLGCSKNGRIWQIEHAANTPFRGSALEIDYTVGVL